MNHANVVRRAAVSVALMMCANGTAYSQGALADYQRAAQFRDAHKLVSLAEVEPNWIEGSDRFWYRRERGQQKSFWLVDPDRNTRTPAFDHGRLAVALSAASDKSYRADALPFDAFEYVDAGAAVAFDVDDARWRCELKRLLCTPAAKEAIARPGEVLSPDKRWAVFLRDYNLWVRDTATDVETTLTTDGEANNEYSSKPVSTSFVSDRLLQNVPLPQVKFSPDSHRLLTFKVDAREVRELALVQTVAAARPVVHTYRYPIAGDVAVAQVQMMGFDLLSKARLPLRHPWVNLTADYDMRTCWNESSTHVCFTEDDRGYKTAKLQVADIRTGEVRTAVVERSASSTSRSPIAQVLGDGREVLWTSERDGWNHLFRIDARTGAVINELTRGEWNVDNNADVRVDQKRGWIYFMANGREPGRDPYLSHFYRVKLDGSRLQLLTPERADHSTTLSPSGRYFIDTYSLANVPPVVTLRASDGRLLRELERSDVRPLIAAGWRAPEPFSVKAADGVTDLYGLMFLPSTFDSSKRYAVLDSIYPGPQTIRTNKAFRVDRFTTNEMSLAELGFIVVFVDGRGTPGRSRSFREYSYGNLGAAGGLEDHVAAIRQLAQRHGYIDVSRVGIYGGSGGGYASTRAMLKFPEFFKVGVSDAGNHEQRSYWAEWGERFQGYPVGTDYQNQSNAALAGQLRGKLLLVHGDLDDNVHPSNTLQLVDALIAANKDFDLLIMPNRNHSLIDLGKGKAAARKVDPYFIRKRWDYFVQHLLGVTPPPEFALPAE